MNPHPDLPAGAPVLIFATAGDAEADHLATELRGFGLEPRAVPLLSQGLSLLLRPAAGSGPVVLAAVVGNPSGLNGPTIARAIRALPGQAHLPLILIGERPGTPLARCLSLPRPLDPLGLHAGLALPVDQWIAAPTGSAPPAVPEASPSAHSPAPASQPAPPPGAPARKRVLVVDDNEVNRLVISRLVTVLGYDTSVVDGGSAALRHLSAQPVDLLLTDCQMPEMDGYELARTIRRNEAGSGRRLPIIAITAHAQTADRQRCLDAGMDDYLTKPANSERLRATLLHWLPDHATASAAPHRESDTVVLPVLFDPRPLRQIDASSPGMAATIISVFREDLEHFLATTPDLERNDAIAMLGQAAHKLKGAAGSIGALQLFNACGELEREARNLDREACRIRLAAAQAAARALHTHLTNLPDTW